MRTRHLAVAGLAAVLLAACGGSDGNGEAAKKGPQVAADAAAALEKAGSAHAQGTGSFGEQQGSVDLDLQGSDVSGTIRIGDQQVKLVGTGGKVYVQAPSAFWGAQAGLPQAAAAMLDGKWIVLPQQAAGQFDTFSLKGLADSLRKPTDGTIQDAVGKGTVGGQEVVVVKQSDGSTVDVAATGTPYPLREQDKGQDAADITFSDFGKKFAIAAPSGALDLSSLAGG